MIDTPPDYVIQAAVEWATCEHAEAAAQRDLALLFTLEANNLPAIVRL